MDRDEQIHPRTGTLIEGRYRIVRRIGEGGMGSIHEVVDLRTDVRRALKLVRPALRSEASFAARLLAEARIVARIKSEHLVPVSDAGIDGETGAAFFVMELLEGESLAALSRRRGPASPAEVVAMLHQVALALDRAHAAGVAHLDLKPENLFATARDDGSPSVKVLDFGIARAASTERRDAPGAAATGDSADARGAIAGTPLYMAPEQLAGGEAIGAAADLHALGLVAFTLLAGEAYFEEDRVSFGDDRAGLRQRLALGIGELPSARALRRRDVRLPPEFDVWLTRATARRPADRFATATDAVTALARALGEPLPRPSIVLQGASRSAPEPLVDRGETTETALTTDRPAARPRPFPLRRAVAAALALTIVALFVLRFELAKVTADATASPPPPASASSVAIQRAPAPDAELPVSGSSVPVRRALESVEQLPVSGSSVPVHRVLESAEQLPVSTSIVPSPVSQPTAHVAPLRPHPRRATDKAGAPLPRAPSAADSPDPARSAGAPGAPPSVRYEGIY